MIHADVIKRAWRKVDIKLALDGDLHVIRWRRGLFADEVFFDDRKVAQTTGLFGRETIYGLEMKTEDERLMRMLLTIDPDTPAWDMDGDMKPGGVRLETADEALIAFGTLGPGKVDRMRESFVDIFERASKALGLS